MKRTLAALTIATLASVSALAVAPAFAKPDSATTETSVKGERGEAKRGQHDGKHAGKHEGKGGKHEARGDHRRGHGAHSPRNMQNWLASNLSTTETLIGITADQKDAWLGYTNALLANFERPARPDVKADADAAKVPFAREQRLIQNANDRAAKAGELSKAIDTLTAKLTPEQLKKLAEADLRFGPPMERGKGHEKHQHGKEHGKGQRDGAKQAAPAATDEAKPAE
jgi:hypothetical protein